jgi:hypothetical protein
VLVPQAGILLTLVLHQTAKGREYEFLILGRYHGVSCYCVAGFSGPDSPVFNASRSSASVNGFRRHCMFDSPMSLSAVSVAPPGR